MEEPKAISPEELEKVAGGKKGKLAQAAVWSNDGGRVKLYYSTYEGSAPFTTIPNGSEMVVEKKVYQAPPSSGRKCDPYYKAYYHDVLVLIKEKEVKIDWM